MRKLVLFLLLMFIITLSSTTYAAEYLTIAELCNILVEDLALSYDISQVNNPFQDVNPEMDYYEDIMIFYGLGILSGTSQNTFMPTRNVTRAEAATVIHRLGIDGGTLDVKPIDVETNTWYYLSISAIISSGVMSVDSSGKFNPQLYLTGQDIDRTKLQLIKQTIPTTPVQLDLTLGSITIEGFPIGNKCSQGGTVVALSNGSYIIRQSESIATSNNISVDKGTVRLTLAGVNTSRGMSVKNSANLILTLVGDNISRISIDDKSSIEISGSGSLIAKSLGNGAGIGGAENGTGGNITINGGTITAMGFNGIGSGNQGRLGNIIINGGIITVGGNAGIGSNYQPGHYGDTSTESRGNIIINGGIINITNATWGIGGFAGNIEINGGTIIAQNISTTAIGGPSPGSNSIVIDESAEISVSFKYPEGRYYLERIFDLELETAAALENKIPKFETIARGASGLIYQWQSSSDNSNWLDITGETSSVLSASITTNNNGYYFRCRVTNAYGNVAYTSAAKGYILAFTKQPTAVVVELGELSAFEVTSTCPNVSYQWQQSFDNGESWHKISGEVYSTLLINTSLNENNSLYRCQITASNGDTLTSDSASLTVLSSVVSYTTRYYLEKADGEGYDLFDQIVTESPAGALVSANERTYDHFTENESLSVTAGTVKSDNSLILSRYYDRNLYTISFVVNGGSTLLDMHERVGANISPPSNPTKMGCTFADWYIDETLTNPFTFSIMPSDNTTLYAKWNIVGGGRGVEYQISKFTLRDTNYSPITSIPNGNFLVEVSVKNLSSVTMDTLLLATYDANGKMLDLIFLYANPPINYTFTLGTNINNHAGNVNRIKAFMLPMLGGLVPLAEAVELSK